MADNWLLTDEEPIPEDALVVSDEIGEVMNAMLEEYVNDEEYEDDLRNILEEDEYLTEELVDKLAALNILEGADEGEVSKEEIEAAYLSVVDSFFELSKMISPLNGFGRDRLEAGLNLIKQFEERRWPVTTTIVPGNAPAFSELIPIEHYDDIMTGRKQAIGAIRTVGEATYAAGAVVYRIFDDPDDLPVIIIDWIMVHEDLREQGIGNFLMAQVIGLALKMPGAYISVDVPVKQGEDQEEMEMIDITENFFDSWKFGFSMNYSNRFVVKLSDVKATDLTRRIYETDEAKCLRELTSDGAEMLKAFFEKRGQSYDADIAALPYDYFDPDVSVVTLSGEDISSVLLFHRLSNGDYRYEAFRSIDEGDFSELKTLVRSAYGNAVKKRKGDPFVFGFFASEEGYEEAGKLIPDARVPMVYRGSMKAPDEFFTGEEWGELRSKAGFSNDFFGDEASDNDMSENEWKLMKAFISDAAGMN